MKMFYVNRNPEHNLSRWFIVFKIVYNGTGTNATGFLLAWDNIIYNMLNKTNMKGSGR